MLQLCETHDLLERANTEVRHFNKAQSIDMPSLLQHRPIMSTQHQSSTVACTHCTLTASGVHLHSIWCQTAGAGCAQVLNKHEAVKSMVQQPKSAQQI